MDLVNLLVVLIVIGAVLGLTWWLVNLPGSPIPPPIRWAVLAILVLVVLVLLLSLLGVPSLTLERLSSTAAHASRVMSLMAASAG